MKYSEIDDCEQCPLKKEEICTGYWTSSPSGTPIEPPCCDFDDDTDLDQWMESYYNKQAKQMSYSYRKLKKEKKKKQEKIQAEKRRKYLEQYCASEIMKVEKAREEFVLYKKRIAFTQSMSFKGNMINEMLGYFGGVNINNMEEELKRLENALNEAYKKLEEKQEKGKRTHKYKSIM